MFFPLEADVVLEAESKNTPQWKIEVTALTAIDGQLGRNNLESWRQLERLASLIQQGNHL